MNTNIFSDIVRGIDPYENPYDVLKICMESTFQYKARAGRLGMVPDDYKDIGSDFRGALRQFGIRLRRSCLGLRRLWRRRRL